MYKKIGLASETIPKEHLDRLSEWIKTYPRLTQGEKVVEFESLFAKYIEVNDSTFVNSGSSANLLMASTNLFYKDLRNKKVGIPALSWATTVSPFIQLGYQPYLLDVDPTNLGINVDDLYKLIKEEDIGTLILVHVLGHNSSIEKILDICEDYDIRLLEDNCQSLGSTISGKRLGSFGLASTCSFFYGHHISTIEGGCLCSNDYEFNQVSKSLRSHGWGRNLDMEFHQNLRSKYNTSDFRDLYTFYYPGYNLRSTELNAFLGLKQMSILDEYCSKRSILFNKYKEELSSFWCQQSSNDFISSFAYATLVKNPEEVWIHLKKKDIESRPLIAGSIGQQPFWKEYSGRRTSLKFADQIHLYGIYLPVNADIDNIDVHRICTEFKKVAEPYNFV
tara:strand:+ start:568 stop:1740 length:1173 start_codon:yes stop_codon:yes gene_type:complete